MLDVDKKRLPVGRKSCPGKLRFVAYVFGEVVDFPLRGNAYNPGRGLVFTEDEVAIGRYGDIVAKLYQIGIVGFDKEGQLPGLVLLCGLALDQAGRTLDADRR